MSHDLGPYLDLDETVTHLRELIRIPSVNPPDGGPEVAAGRDPAGGETAAARYCAEVLAGAGIEADVLETVPGRGSCFARLRASGPATEPPLILLSHIDVVPVDAEAWSRDPFGGELVGGEVWGRGAVDMKNMVAMELGVMLALARSGAELRRDVIFAAVADEEAGGAFGAQHWARERPDLFADAAGRPAAVALNEVGGYSMTIGGRRFYTLQVAEKGIVWTRLRTTGTPGHGSMPHDENAAIRLAEAVSAIAAQQAARPARVIPTVAAFLATLGLSEVAELAEQDPAGASAVLGRKVGDPVLRRSLEAMLRDTVTPNVLRAGKKVNVIPGSGEAEIDVRTLPGTDQEQLLAELQAAAGDRAAVESVVRLPAIEWPADAEIVGLMRDAVRRADPDAEPVPMMITPGTDAKALAELGIPCYGFAPLRLDPDVPFLSLFHGHDERVPVSALAFGLPVLADVITRYAVR
ncbi:MAG TPA: M20/M25/M40 family metallo-hydrolase [Candidatus Limnocylindrales bacterium]|nr:M20/M25/M40 family metallo-hydrolase [Candidatus Limnocylindrales bacterium]